jgi:hypothetical protein
MISLKRDTQSALVATKLAQSVKLHASGLEALTFLAGTQNSLTEVSAYVAVFYLSVL